MGVSSAGGAPLSWMAAEAVGWSVIPSILLQAGPFLCFENSKERGLVLSLKQPTPEQVKELARIYSADARAKHSVNNCKALFSNRDTFSVPRATTSGSAETLRCKFCQISNVTVRKAGCLVYEGIVAWHPPCDNCRLSLLDPIQDHIRQSPNTASRCILENLQSALKVYSAFPNEVETPLLSMRRGGVGLEASLFLPGRHAQFDGNSSPFSFVSPGVGDAVLRELLSVFEVLDHSLPDRTFFQTSKMSAPSRKVINDMAGSPLSGLHMYPGGAIVRSSDRLLCDDVAYFAEKSPHCLEFEIEPMWTRCSQTPADPTYRAIEDTSGFSVGAIVVDADVRTASNLHAFCAEVREKKTILPFQFRFTNAHMGSSQKIRQLMRIASSFESTRTVFTGKLAPSADGDYAFVFLALSTRQNRPLDRSILSPAPSSSRTFLEWRVFDVFTDPLRHLPGLSRLPWGDTAVRTHALSSCIVYDSKLITHLKTHLVSYRKSTFFDRMMSGGGRMTPWTPLTDDVRWREVDCDGEKRVLVSCTKKASGEWGKLVFVFERCGTLAEIEDKNDISNMQKLRLIQEQSLSDHNAFFFRCFGSNETFLSPSESRAFLKIRMAKKKKKDVRALVCSFDNSQEGCITIDPDTAFPYYRWGAQFDNRARDDRLPVAPTVLSLAIGLSRFIEIDNSPVERMDERYTVKAFFFKILSQDTRTRHLTDLLPLPHTVRVDGVREGCLRVLNAYFVFSCRCLPVSGFPKVQSLSNDRDRELCELWANSLSKTLLDGDTAGAFVERRGVAMRAVIFFFRSVLAEMHKSEESRMHEEGKGRTKRKKRCATSAPRKRTKVKF